MALGDERRASGQAMEASRRAIDGAMRAARQSTFKSDLNALESGNTARRRGSLPVVEPVGGRPATTARVDYTPPATTAGGGIASPLTEETYASREYHPSRTIRTVDGIFSIRESPIKKITQEDANGEEVIQLFAAPT